MCNWELACTASDPAHSRSANWIPRHPLATGIVRRYNVSGGTKGARPAQLWRGRRSYVSEPVACAGRRGSQSCNAICAATSAEQGAQEPGRRNCTARLAPPAGRLRWGCRYLEMPKTQAQNVEARSSNHGGMTRGLTMVSEGSESCPCNAGKLFILFRNFLCVVRLSCPAALALPRVD